MLQSQVVLVTGASHGIGLATVEQLSKAGCQVYAGTRDPSKAEKLQELASKVNNIFIQQLDITSDDSVNKVVSDIVEKEGKISALVNNAGFGMFGTVDMHSMKEINAIFEVNFFGAIRMTNAVLPIMRKQNEGRVICLSSISGVIPSKFLPIYSAAKAALEFVAANYAAHNAKWNILFSNIQPGPVVTDFETGTAFSTGLKDDDNPYVDDMHEWRADWKKMMDKGQNVTEVAEVIQSALEDRDPKFWYQTTHSVTESIGKHFKDLTGKIRIPAGLPVAAARK